MSDLVRFGVSIDAALLEKFDKQIEKKGYTNRSEAIRDLIRDHMVAEEWTTNAEVIGTITMVYDHHTRELSQTMMRIQHSFPGNIWSCTHIHIDHHNCLEVIVVQGPGHQIQSLADRLISLRGIKHGRLTATTTGQFIPARTSHHTFGDDHLIDHPQDGDGRHASDGTDANQNNAAPNPPAASGSEE